MEINRDTRVFFDASCLIAGAFSAEGGSRFLLDVCEKEYLVGVVSQPVLIETERNIRKKFSEDMLTTYHRLVQSISFLNAPVPLQKQQKFPEDIVEEKDVHVVVGVLESQTPYLITLDKNLQANVNSSKFSVKGFSPGEFIKKVFVHHVDYSELRDSSWKSQVAVQKLNLGASLYPWVIGKNDRISHRLNDPILSNEMISGAGQIISHSVHVPVIVSST